jgi:hypothetical protein
MHIEISVFGYLKMWYPKTYCVDDLFVNKLLMMMMTMHWIGLVNYWIFFPTVHQACCSALWISLGAALGMIRLLY